MLTTMQDYQVFEFAAVDTNYLRLYAIPLLAGRNLSAGDTTGKILSIGHSLKILVSAVHKMRSIKN
jgi:hypothetical protein